MAKKVFLDNACTSLFDPRVLNAATVFTELLQDERIPAGDVTRICRGYLEETRGLIAEFIHCSPREIAVMESTSHALGAAANAIPLEKDDNVLVADIEYLASTLCWKRRQEQIGFELRKVETTDGKPVLEDFKRCFDAHTRVIMLSSIQEITGWRADLREISDFLKDKNCYLVVDGVQEAGAMRVDVRASGVDFYAAGGKKYIGNPFGKGFLYVKDALLPKLKPDFYAYFKVKLDEKYGDFLSYQEDPARSPFDRFELIEEAAKFENGGFDNYIGILGLAEAIRLHQEIGQETIEKKIKELNLYYQDGLDRLGIRSCASREDKRLSATVSFNFGFPNGDNTREKRLVQYLLDRNIFVSMRCSTGTGGVRASVNYYNTKEDIDALLRGIADFLADMC